LRFFIGKFLVLLVVLFVPISAMAACGQPPSLSLRVAYVPIFSYPLAKKRSQALFDFFQQHYDVTLNLLVTKDFQHYLQQAKNQQFDLTLSQVNYALAFDQHLGFKPLVQSGHHYSVVVLRHRDDTRVQNLQDLRGKQVAEPEQLSFARFLFEQKLRSLGLDARQDMFVVPYPRHDQLFMALVKGEVDAAISVDMTLALAGSTREKLAEVARIPAGPAVFSASSALTDAHQQWLGCALLAFAASEQAGPFLQGFGLQSLQPFDRESAQAVLPDAVMLQPYLDTL
jgi:ABC-type phosphate/phosphonate transport system substrate-binding protein